jgi:saccharopine dehydrogenase (NAD+, L-lysine forming)
MNKNVIGIRREDKNQWEVRAPLIPDDVQELVRDYGFRVIVQPSDNHRAFSDQSYIDAGAEINEDLSDADIIVGVKEIPDIKFLPEKVYLFFAHVIKGQPYNMPMLDAMMHKNCTLIDYEKIESDDGKRLIFFGRFAGLAGMVETLSAYGKRLSQEGISNPFEKIEQPYHYNSLAECVGKIWEVSHDILENGLPLDIKPFICGITGYGNVSKGAQEIVNLLPVTEISADDLRRGMKNLPPSDTGMYKVVFEEKDLFRPKDPSKPFILSHYYKHPEEYDSIFAQVAPMLSVMANCIFWTDACPRLLTKTDIKDIYSVENPRLKVIGDISCDVEGSVEATVAITDLDTPCFVYDVDEDYAIPGFVGNGPAIMSIENLPCEIPAEASREFSGVLKKLFPGISFADFSKSLDETGLPNEIKRAVIVLKGSLTEKYKYIEESLAEHI